MTRRPDFIDIIYYISVDNDGRNDREKLRMGEDIGKED